MSSFSQEVFADYPRRLEVLEILLPYLNIDEAADFYFPYDDCRELIEQALPKFKEALWCYDRHHTTVRSYNYKNRQPETIACQAAVKGHLPAVVWGWDHYVEQVRRPEAAIVIMRHAIKQGQANVVKFLLKEGCCYDLNSAMRKCNDAVWLLLQDYPSQAKSCRELEADLLQDIFEANLEAGGDKEVLEYLLQRGVEITKHHLLLVADFSPRLFPFLWERFDSSHLEASDYVDLLHGIRIDRHPEEGVKLFKYLLQILPGQYGLTYWKAALEIALRWGNSELVHLMLSKGATATEPIYGDIPRINWVASTGNLELVKFIIDNPSLIYSPVDSSILHWATTSDNLELVLWLLEHHGRLFQQKDYEESLADTIRYSSPSKDISVLVKLMLDLGARNYQESLEECVEHNRPKAAKLLLEHASERDIVLDRASLARSAAACNSPGVLALLVELGLERAVMESLVPLGYRNAKTVEFIMEACGDDIDYCQEIEQQLAKSNLQGRGLSLELIQLLRRRQPDRLDFFVDCLLNFDRNSPDFVYVASLVEELLAEGAQVRSEKLGAIEDAELAAIYFRALLKQGIAPLRLLDALLSVHAGFAEEPPKRYFLAGSVGNNDLGGPEYLYQVLLEQIEDREVLVKAVGRLVAENSSNDSIIRMLRRSQPIILELVLREG